MSGPVDVSPSGHDRLRVLEAALSSAASAVGVEELLDDVLDMVGELLRADTVAVLLLDPSGRELVVTAAKGLEEELRQGVRIPVGKGFAGRVAADGRAHVIERVDHSNVINPILWQKGVRSLLGVPLRVGGTVLGVLHVGTLTIRPFTSDDANLLQAAADRIALSVRGRLSLTERAAAAALQRSLLPARLPDVPGLELAARYVPGEAGGIGGDWYDVFVLPSGRLGVVIADVAGRGLRAAVVMGRLRSALRAYALEATDPADAIDRLDRKVLHFEPGILATVLYAVVDPSLTQVQVSLAGHPAPVLAAPGRPAALADLPVDPPVGVRAGLPRRNSTIELPGGAVLCLYTDGLVERRRQQPDVGQQRLCQAVTVGPADEVCAGVMNRLVGADAAGDDIALLVLRRLQQEPVGFQEVRSVLPGLPVGRCTE